MTHYGMFGAPGERQSGKRDVKTEAGLPAVQTGTQWLALIIGCLFIVPLAFALGGLCAWFVGFALAWMTKDRLAHWFETHSGNVRITAAALFILEDLPFAVITVLALVLINRVLPYRWCFDWTTRHGYLILLREASWEWYNPEIGRMVTETGPDNIVRRFPLLVRALLIVLPVTYYAVIPSLVRRYEDEKRQPVPAAAANYAEVGFDTRRWGAPEPEAQQAEVAVLRVEHIDNMGARGNRITAIRELPYRDEIIAAFVALNSGRVPHLSRRNLRDIGIGDDIARNIMTALEDAGYIEYPGGNRNKASILTGDGEDLAVSIGSGLDAG